MAGKRKKGKRRPREKQNAAAVVYTDGEGNTLRLRRMLSEKTIAKIAEPPAGDAASIDDAWQRREEMLFERLVVDWEVAGLPLGDQKMLLGRYRMATPAERRWIRTTIADHIEKWIPQLKGSGRGLDA
jgi:hypothetical protein